MQPILDTPLMYFEGEDPSISLTLSDATHGIFIGGNTGSGKTSGSGKHLLMRFMTCGLGGLILTVKSDELDHIRRCCMETNRLDDLVVISNDPGCEHAFNFLDYCSTADTGIPFASNLQQTLNVVLQAGEERASGKSNDPFWSESQSLLIKATISLSLLAYNTVTVELLHEIAISCPKKAEEGQVVKDDPENAFNKAMELAKERVFAKVEAWKEKSGEHYIKSLSDDEYMKQLMDQVPDFRTLKMVRHFFKETFYNISEKTKGIITLSLVGFLGRLLDEPLYSIFCKRKTSVTPEDCYRHNKIVVINLPVALYERSGQDAQIMCKYIFQKAWQKRNLKESTQPVFLWADEAQEFIHPQDTNLQATARSSNVCTVYLTQNLMGMYANIGGDGQKGVYKVKGFLATLSTKIFHCQNDPETNEWASSLIGKAYTLETTENENYDRSNASFGSGKKYILESMVRAEEFGMLRTGGKINDYIVEAYIVTQGKRFSNGFPYRKIRFKQSL